MGEERSGADSYLTKEARARVNIDRMLVAAGWAVQDTDSINLAAAQGYSVQRSADSHAGRKLYLGYLNAAGGADRLEVDLNFLHQLPLLVCQRRPIWQPLGRPFLEVVVHAPEELVAGKLCALFSRRLPRDLFDAARIPDVLGEDWLQTPARPLFVALAGTLDRPYYKHVVQRLRDDSLGDVEAELRPLLRLDQRLRAEDLRARAWAVIEPLIHPTDEGPECTDRLQAGGSFPNSCSPTTSRWRTGSAGIPPFSGRRSMLRPTLEGGAEHGGSWMPVGALHE